jgi:hypothetical protein
VVVTYRAPTAVVAEALFRDGSGAVAVGGAGCPLTRVLTRHRLLRIPAGKDTQYRRDVPVFPEPETERAWIGYAEGRDFECRRCARWRRILGHLVAFFRQ